LTAPKVNFASDNSARGTAQMKDAAVRCLDKLCQSAIDGRYAVRDLLPYLQRYSLGEPDLQVLWSLRNEPPTGLDQTTLAGQLAYSAAQVSATVEKLRKRGLLSNHESPGDRRRRLWKLSADGQSLIREVMRLVEVLSGANAATIVDESASPREAAA
jgi:DNA-binding MarR family transcriptional regulator